MAEVRCPYCGRKLAECLMGTLFIWCRTCQKIIRIDTGEKATVS